MLYLIFFSISLHAFHVTIMQTRGKLFLIIRVGFHYINFYSCRNIHVF